jgi:fatty-acyl-CoA synthase
VTAHPATTGTIAELLLARLDDQHAGLQDETTDRTWREVVREGAVRGSLARSLHEQTAGSTPFHIGVLLPNVPEYLLWLGGAALVGAAIVGINPTRRGAALAADIRATDCALLVTDSRGASLLEGIDHGVDPAGILCVDTEAYGALLDERRSSDAATGVLERAGSVPLDQLYLLLFTSGTTGTPKAVRCTQGRLAAIGKAAAPGYGYHREDVCYCPMPLFHGNALMALWAPALQVGATVALRPRFSATAFLDDVRRFHATTFSYVGKAIAYILATPERPDDAENTLERAFGTEASLRDRREFRRRFGCRLIEGYGQSEGGSAINVVPGTPAGALGRPVGEIDLAIVNPETGDECPPAQLDAAGRLLNGDEAIGEIVNRSGIGSFEGYYRNDHAEAERTRNGWYWSGDLGYRDTDGFFYFAGRRGDWLRVDSENFAAGPVEAVLGRHPDVAVVAVYPVPDTTSGDQVMAAFELRGDAAFDPGQFATWLEEQADLGTKWAPRFVRVMESLPQTATGKVTKVDLRRGAWCCDDPVWWRPDRSARTYRLLTEEDRGRLRKELAQHARESLLR